MIAKRVNKKGFTLVEVIIAMAIITIVAATFYKVYFIAIKSTNAGKQRIQALTMAQSYLEEVKARKDVNAVIIPDVSGYKFEVYTRTDELDENNELLNIVVKVTPKDTKAIELGTKIYIKH